MASTRLAAQLSHLAGFNSRGAAAELNSRRHKDSTTIGNSHNWERHGGQRKTRKRRRGGEDEQNCQKYHRPHPGRSCSGRIHRVPRLPRRSWGHAPVKRVHTHHTPRHIPRGKPTPRGVYHSTWAHHMWATITPNTESSSKSGFGFAATRTRTGSN
jgi:hypothetical protein